MEWLSTGFPVGSDIKYKYNYKYKYKYKIQIQIQYNEIYYNVM